MNVMFDSKLNDTVPSSHVNKLTSALLSLFVKHKHSIMADPETIRNIERVVKSDHLQKVYKHRQLKTYIEPQKVDLYDDEGNVVCTYTYTPIRSLCEKYLANESLVRHLVNEGHGHLRSNSRNYGHFMDGQVYKDRRLYGNLKLEVYLDDANVSPSNRNDKQETLFIYLTIADLPFEYRTKRCDIETLIIANRFQLKKMGENGLKSLLHRFKNDLLDLYQSGIDVLYNGQVINIKVELASVLGDNLQTNEVLGYKKNFNNYSFVCRYCGSAAKVRDRANEINQLDRVYFLLDELEPGQSEAQDKLDYGIMRDFVFDGLPKINRLTLCPPDASHDIAVGVLAEMLPFILRGLVLNHGISLEIILERFNDFAPLLYEGAPLFKFKSPTHFKFIGKAIQVCA